MKSSENIHQWTVEINPSEVRELLSSMREDVAELKNSPFLTDARTGKFMEIALTDLSGNIDTLAEILSVDD